MWICLKCGYKNNNSSTTCHNSKCKAEKPTQIIKQEQKQFNKKHVRDYCPVCLKHRNFVHITGKKYKCPICHKTFRMIGKPVPETKKEKRVKIVETKNNTNIKIEQPIS